MTENTTKLNKLNILDGVKDGIPICIGYFPIAMAFGILAKGANLNFYETISFSFIVFAGASQFIAVSMIAMGSSAMEIILTTLFLNFRHFLMSASLSPKINNKNPFVKMIISFFVTDESFSVASFAKGQVTEKYMLPMQLMGYFGWGIGTGVGFVVGSVLPLLLQQSMNIGLYSMFVALLVPEMKKITKAIVLALLSGALNTLLNNVLRFPQGWSIVLSIIIVSGFGVLMYQKEEKEVIEHE